MKKYDTVTAALSALSSHPAQKNARYILQCRNGEEVFYVISLTSIDFLRQLQPKCFASTEFMNVAVDLKEETGGPNPISEEKKVLHQEAENQMARAHWSDPVGEIAAAKECIKILKSAGGSVSQAKAALSERHPHPGWI